MHRGTLHACARSQLCQLVHTFIVAHLHLRQPFTSSMQLSTALKQTFLACHLLLQSHCSCKKMYVRADARVVYTFDVYWEESDMSWASRWDAYLNMPGGRVHWFSILNSLMVVLVMSSIVAMIMMRTIRRDLQRYEGLLGDAGQPSLHSFAQQLTQWRCMPWLPRIRCNSLQ